MNAFVDNNIRSRQSNCTRSNDTDFPERREMDSSNNIRVVGCEGTNCINATGVGSLGICFFPNGSSASLGNRNDFYIFHSAGDNTTHATNAYRFTIWRTTSFIETFTCRGNATFDVFTSNALSCNTWIEE